jgi:hypothetical protein
MDPFSTNDRVSLAMVVPIVTLERVERLIEKEQGNGPPNRWRETGAEEENVSDFFTACKETYPETD